MSVFPADGVAFDLTVPVVIVGGGACGMVAALAAADRGAEVIVLERDPVPRGSTALSSGMIPACGTKVQSAKGIEDTPEVMAADIKKKARGEADPAVVEAVCAASGPAIDWLTDRHGIELTLVEGFVYPGHSCLRMHAPPSRAGADLIGALSAGVERADVDVVTDAHATTLYADADGRLRGLAFERPDGTRESLGCRALVLACNGYGGNPEMIRRYIPDMAEANYFGHAGNRGDAVLWGRDLGAGVRHVGAYQGHGSVAHPHGVLVTWALMMEGGFQVNAEGRRFSNEHDGYSEQARRVLAQPGGIAWDIYDHRIHALGREFEDYGQAEDAGAIRSAAGTGELAEATGLPADNLAATIEEVHRFAAGEGQDPFGRDFTTKPALEPPYYAVRVTGSLFHTQGGLVVDGKARVLKEGGTPLPNLFAGGGAACGISGPADWGYLSGNGLLTAVVLGRIAGEGAASRAACAL
ncbi:MAG: FAD-dependent oxidoreductase [Rhodospirillales bacterium]|jgi:fumarate reductase flavoprotein subunit|nr:FAD-dependent oxidoreductase [Rhodospirillales bacterium]